jgi:hypothetical protein
MKKAINVISMCAFVLLLNSVALGQKRSAKDAATKQAIFQSCKGQPILWVRRLIENGSSQNQTLTGAVRSLNEFLFGHDVRISVRFRA